MKKTIIITGGNSGLGYACAELIAGKSQEYRIILGCRDSGKGIAAKEELTAKTGNTDIFVIPLDLASLSSVRRFVEKCKEMKMTPVYGLICNAGIAGNHFGRTDDGLDCIFETNHLGHFLLTMLLLPMMQVDGRILAVSSDMHCPPTGELTWLGTEALARPGEELSSQLIRYSYSKLCNLYFVYELSRRLQEQQSGVIINAFNPGLMTETNFSPDKSRFTEAMLKSVSDRIGSLAKSAGALSDLMTEPKFGAVSGEYYDRSTSTCKSSPLSYNMDNAKELWKRSIEFANLAMDEIVI